MTPAERDKSIVEHLAGAMGWTPFIYGGYSVPETGGVRTLDLDSWAHAGMVWEKAQTVLRDEALLELRLIVAWLVIKGNLSPRAICYAVAEATGWKGPKETSDVQ